MRLPLPLLLLLDLVAGMRAPPACTADQVAAAEALVGRVLGGVEAASAFKLSCSAQDVQAQATPSFELHASPAGGPIAISGTTGVALASGFHWYLKHYANTSIMYGHGSIGKPAVPSSWPAVPTALAMQSPTQFSYYMNVCTHSYSAAWWDWPRWEAEIDVRHRPPSSHTTTRFPIPRTDSVLCLHSGWP